MMLQGKCLISTVSVNRSVEIRNLFESLGASVVDFPMSEVLPEERTPVIVEVVRQIKKFNWIIFTSASGVIHFYRLLKEIANESRIPEGVKIAAVGLKTAKEIENHSGKVDFTGSGNTVGDLIDELMAKESLRDCHILVPLGNLAPDTLEKRLSTLARVTRINVYRTVKAGIADPVPLELIKDDRYDLVLFTSPSGVDNFSEAIGSSVVNREIRAACIGSVTASAVEHHGYHCVLTAEVSTYEGLAKEIINYFNIKN
jgi:uroporphyrinogen-III synthase